MGFRVSVLTLYPHMFPGPLGFSLAGKALESGIWSCEAINMRDYAQDRHKTVDGKPAGGGAGMILRPDIIARAIDDLKRDDLKGSGSKGDSGSGSKGGAQADSQNDGRPRILPSPRGKPLKQSQLRQWAKGEGMVIVCGHFEGVDERVIEARGLTEVCIGDYIVSGGETAAFVLLDALVRLLPGVMGNEESARLESFENGLLEHPHYTQPNLWEGRAVPDVLRSGNHAEIERWRREQALETTKKRRADLFSDSAS